MARATPDFFAHQRAARRRTALLLAWFAIALVILVALAYAALALPLVLAGDTDHLWRPGLLAGVAIGVLGTTGAGCVHHAIALARGGLSAIVEPLGATRVDPGGGGPRERRLRNVVEEMAIASGVPVPQVFVLDREEAINALAAGTSGNAAVVVTAGAVDQLSRDELQGVVAHEFSHLLNGDAVLNARLMGMLGGLTILDLFGREALRVAWSAGRSRWRVGLVLVPTGIVLAVAGWMGVLCGQLVRCGVSRQREFLADAAAAQFTRNPGALARALARIRDRGSALRWSRALEASHFFFANALEGSWSRWLSTHPPLEERIRRLDPSAARAPGSAETLAPAGRVGEEGAATYRGHDALPAIRRVSTAAIDRPAASATVGALHGDPVGRARAILGSLPPAIAAAARSVDDAPALLLALAMAPDDAARSRQLDALASRAHPWSGGVTAVERAAGALSRAQRLAAADLALATVRPLAPARLATLHDALARVAAADDHVTVFDWMLLRLVGRRVERRREGERRPAVRFRALVQVEVECLQLLSLVAWSGTRDGAAAQAAVTAALAQLGIGAGWHVLPREKLGREVAESALRTLEQASPALKQALVRACEVASGADARVTVPEAEVLRVIAASLDCPTPLLLPGARLPDSVHSGEWRTAIPK